MVIETTLDDQDRRSILNVFFFLEYLDIETEIKTVQKIKETMCVVEDSFEEKMRIMKTKGK